MRWLEICFGLGLLSCSPATSPSHTGEITTTTQQSPRPPQAPALSLPAADAPPIMQEGALLTGTVLRIVALAPEEPLLKEASSLIGLLCVVGEASLFLEKDGYAKGAAVCGSKKVLTHFTRTQLSIVYQTQKKQPEPSPVVAFTGSSVSVGKPFTIHAIGGGDAYFTRAKELLGRSCVVTRELKNLGDDWFTGTAKCGLPAEYMFFSEVSVIVK